MAVKMKIKEYPFYECPKCSCNFKSLNRPDKCPKCDTQFIRFIKYGFAYYNKEKRQKYRPAIISEIRDDGTINTFHP